MKVRERGGLCRMLPHSLRERENNTKEPRVSIKDGRDHDDELSRPERRERSSLLLSAKFFFPEVTVKPRLSICGPSDPKVSILLIKPCRETM